MPYIQGIARFFLWNSFLFYEESYNSHKKRNSVETP